MKTVKDIRIHTIRKQNDMDGKVKKKVVRTDVAERKKENQKLRSTVVKCCLRGNLEDSEKYLPLINDLVLTVSKCARYGSLLFNAVLIDALESNNGIFPTDRFQWNDPKFLNNLVRRCFTNAVKHEPIAEVYNRHKSIFDKMKPTRLQGDGNAITYSSNQYITNFKNHVIVNIDQRITRLVKCFVASQDIKLGKGVRFLGIKRVLGTSNKSFDNTTPSEFVSFIEEWETRQKAATTFQLQVEFLYVVLMSIRDYGGKMYSIAPIISNGRQYVTIDHDVLWPYFYNNCFKKMGIIDEDMKQEDFDKLDYQDHLFTIFKSQIGKLKKKENGWRFGRTIETDGYGLVVHFIHETQQKQKKKLKVGDFTYTSLPNDYIVAFDPGMANILYGVTEERKVSGFKFTRYDYYKKGGIYASKKIHERWNLKIKVLLEEMSKTTFKTPSLQDFMAYVNVCAENHDTLWDNLGHTRRNRNKMATYMSKVKAMDTFLASVKSKDNSRRTVVAYGAARFNCSIKGCVSTPTVAAYKLCRKHYPTYPVDEFRTSRVCHHCDHELIAPFHYKSIVTVTGVTKRIRIETRGVRWCSSTKCLGSRCIDPEPGVCVKHSRDFVGAKNILRCFGKTNMERPEALRRPRD